MARAKTSAKKPAATKKSSGKKSSNISDWLRTNRMWLFVLIFAVAGTYYLVRTYANPKLPTYSDDIVAGYINLTPTAVAQDESGNLSYEMYPASTYVLRDGTLVCDPGAAGGASVKTGSLSKKEVERIHRDVVNTDVRSLPDEVSNGEGQALVQFEGFLVGEDDGAKGTAVYAGAQKPEKFSKAVSKLQALCDKATRTEERAKLKEPREPKVKATKNKSVVSFLDNLITPSASACCSVGTRDTAFENEHGNAINNYRASVGRARLPRTACLDDKALVWAGQMATAGKISHSTTIAQDTAKCNANWRKAGENVGVGYDSSGLMKAFIASPTHNANLLDPAWRAMGIGGVRHPDRRIFVVQRYVAY